MIDGANYAELPVTGSGSEGNGDEVVLSISASIASHVAHHGETGRTKVSALVGDASQHADQQHVLSALDCQLPPACTAASKLLSHFACRQSTIHNDVLDLLKAQMDTVATGLNQVYLEKLLRQTVQLIDVPELKPVVVAVLERLDSIPHQFLQSFIDKAIISELPHSVKYQAWKAVPVYFTHSIESVLQENAAAKVLDSSQMNERLAQHAARICSMIIGPSLKELFDAFADHCAQQSIAGRSLSAAPERDVPSSSSAVAVSKGPKYNYPGLLQKVLMVLQEGGNKVQSAEKLHDIAIILDRCRRQGRVDPASVDAIFDCIKLMIRSFEWGASKDYPAPAPTALHLKVAQRQSKPKSTSTSARKGGGGGGRMVKVGKKRALGSEDEDTDSFDGDDDVRSRPAAALKKPRAAEGGSGGTIKRAKREAVPPSAARGAAADVPVNKELERGLLRALKAIRQVNGSADFEFEITDETVPGYSTRIKRPMHLGRIEEKIQAHAYLTAAACGEDVKLMTSNCKKWWGPQSIYYNVAQDIESVWENELAALKHANQGPHHKDPPTLQRQQSSSAAPSVPVTMATLKEALRKSVSRMETVDSDLGTEEILHQVLEAAHEYLRGVDDKKFFEKPVSDREAPNYSAIIRDKMALSNMKTKLTRRDYSSVDEFEEDVKLIVANCRTYNAANATYLNYAAKFAEHWELFRNRLLEVWPQITSDQQREALDREPVPSGGAGGSSSGPSTTTTVTGNTSEAAGVAEPMIESTSSEGIRVDAAIAEKADAAPLPLRGPAVPLPAPSRGTFVCDGSNIQLEYILKPEDFRACALQGDLQSQATLIAMMNKVAEYIAFQDADNTFSTTINSAQYAAVIAKPMDLSVIRVKIMSRRHYKAIEDFDRDLSLMFQNCLTFYIPDDSQYWDAEICQYAWYLSYQNLRSVLQDDASLAVELAPEHITVVEDQDQQPEPEEAEMVADNLAWEDAEPVKARRLGRQVVPSPSASEDDEAVDEEEEAGEEAEIPASFPARAIKAEKPMKPIKKEAPYHKPPVERKPAKTAPMAVIKQEAYIPALQLHPRFVAGHAQFDLEQDGSPECVQALRHAVRQVNHPPCLVAGLIVPADAARQYAEGMGCASAALKDLPAVPTDASLRLALTLLRDISVQALLRKQFAMRLRDLVTASRDVSYLTADCKDVAQPPEPGQFAGRVVLPGLDPTARNLFQLCQMAVTYEHRIDPLDEVVLRVYVPLVVRFVLQPASASASAPAAASVQGAQGAAKLLAAQAKEVLRGVFAQQTLESLAVRRVVKTCFSDLAILREFLESIAKHLINMKLGPQ